jgi:hypothetical protein
VNVNEESTLFGVTESTLFGVTESTLFGVTESTLFGVTKNLFGVTHCVRPQPTSASPARAITLSGREKEIARPKFCNCRTYNLLTIPA